MEGQTLGFEQNATANELSSYLLLFNFDWEVCGNICMNLDDYSLYIIIMFGVLFF